MSKGATRRDSRRRESTTVLERKRSERWNSPLTSAREPIDDGGLATPVRLASWLLVFILAVYVRLLFLPKVFTPDGIRFWDGDSYLHLRRIFLTLSSYPTVASFDNYSSFPLGMDINWPPLWDFTAATIAWLIGFGRPSEQVVLTVAALFPVFVGILTLIPLGFAAKYIFGQRAAWPVVAVAAVYPAIFFPSLVGSIDHTAGIELFHISGLAVVSWVLSRTESDLRPGTRNFLICLVAITAIISGALLTWLGSILFVGFTGAFLFMMAITRGATFQRRLFVLGLAFLLSAVVLLPFNNFSFTFAYVSLFHIILLVLIAFALIGAVGVVSSDRLNKKIKIAIVLLGTLVLAAVAVVYGNSIWLAAYGGFAKAFGLYAWAKSTLEWQPLLANDPLGSAANYYGKGAILIPVAAFLLPYWQWKTGRLGTTQLFFYGWSLVAAAAALGARVHYQLFAASAVLLLAGGLPVLWSYATDGLSTSTVKTLQKWVPSALPLVVIMIAVSGAGIFSRYPVQFGNGMHQLLDWVRHNTPETSSFADTRGRPEYGIISPWSYGGAIPMAARRPTVADGQNESNLAGFVLSQKFFQTTNEDETMSILQDNNIRYVLVGPYFTIFQGNLWEAGPPEGPRPIETASAVSLASQSSNYTSDLTYSRLFLPMRPPQARSFGQLRLVYVARDEEAQTVNNYLYLYEMVKGARIIGKARSSEPVIASVTLLYGDQGMSIFTYTSKPREDLSFELFLPNATEGANGTVRASFPYKITNGNYAGSLSVSEEQVQEGKTLSFDF